MDKNKIKRKIFNIKKIKPSHIVSLGYFIFSFGTVIRINNSIDLSSALIVLGGELFIYGIGYAVVKDLTK